MKSKLNSQHWLWAQKLRTKVGLEDDYSLSIAEERKDKIEYVSNIESETEESSEPTGMNLKSNI